MTEKTKAFIATSDAAKAIQYLQDFFKKKGGLNVSDVVDEKGFQYVDLVQQGGGVWGIALAGYTYVLEQMGIRFFSVAGTSAGAINSMLIACMGNKEDEKSTGMIDELLAKDLFDFVDGKTGNYKFTRFVKNTIQKFVVRKNFVKRMLSFAYWITGILLVLCFACFIANFAHGFIGELAKWIGLLAALFLLFIAGLAIYLYDAFKNFTKNGNGLNAGDDFHNWIKTVIQKHTIGAAPLPGGKPIRTLSDFQQHFERLPAGLQMKHDDRRKDDAPPSKPAISIITSDITSERKIEFPRMWDLYWAKMEDIHPADFVRASMSIPVFFQTFTIHDVSKNSTGKIWDHHLDWQGKVIPHRAQFVDGGALSNFPISVFANPSYPVPRMPTFGIKLIDELPDQTKNNHTTFAGYAGSIIGTMRANYDRDFINKNRAFELGVMNVMLKNHNWLNFFMNEKEKIEIFNCGVNAASEFLQKFDWEIYKTARADNALQRATPDMNPNNFHL